MGTWIRVDANLDHHPKAKHAGRWGKTVAQLVWRLIKRHGRDGVISASYLSGENLADEDGAHDPGDPTPDMYSAGLQRAIAAGFFKVLPDGRIEAVDWDDYQWDRTSAKRQQRLRDKLRSNATSRDVAVTSRNVTGEAFVTLDAQKGQKVTPPSPTPPPPDPTPTPIREGGGGTQRPPASPPVPPGGPSDLPSDPEAPASIRKQQRIRTLTVQPSDVCAADLSNPERVRRWFYLQWSQRVGDGTPYPQEPEKDDGQARRILNYHRQNKIAVPWEAFVKQVVDAYFGLDDRMLTADRYPMRLLSMKLPAILSLVRVT